MMLIGICGKTNTGKTTMFSAATLVDAEISNRVFTTIEPNKGVTYVRTECPCKKLGIKCNPVNSKCIDGFRFVPVKAVDIAGLVPDAHLGKGLGNQFLSELMEASALINVIDISGSTDSSGNPVAPGTHNPKEDIEFFFKEIDYWILGILMKNWNQVKKSNQLNEIISKQLTGLGIRLEEIEDAINQTGIDSSSQEDELLNFIRILRRKSKPIIIAANKIDVPGADELYSKIKEKFLAVACSAEAELALRRAAEKGLIKYMPGDPDFEIISEVDEKHKAALEFIRQLLKKYGSTGVQDVINKAVFDLLDMIVVYPVENEHKYSDKKGNVLPDAFLMKRGSTALDLAYRVHEDIGRKFIAAVDARSGKNVSAHYELKDGDIISIKSGR
jgi:ribosome-binding ATPase YchF (GTP1/OBG family)